MNFVQQKFTGMTELEFKDLIQLSARKYLDYIKASDKMAGQKVIEVAAIRRHLHIPSRFFLITHEKVDFADSVQIWIHNKRFSSITPLRYQKTEKGVHALLVDDTKGILASHPEIDPSQIKIVSDLTFLIERLAAFYRSQILSFSPPPPPDLKDLPERFSADLSQEQSNAVNGACTSPLSFISGAPGTGKTKMVLSRCILRYVLSGKRVFLLAPTNNAVEQMLRGVLPVLKEAGIPLTKVYRLGMSSEEFARQYPEVVGDTTLEELHRSLDEQAIHLQQLIRDCDLTYEEISSRSWALSDLTNLHEQVHPLLCTLSEERSVLRDAKHAAELAVAERDHCRAAFANAAKTRESAQSKLQATEQLITQKNRQLNLTPDLLWWKKRRSSLSAELMQLLVILPEYQQQYEQAKEAEQSCSQKSVLAFDTVTASMSKLHDSEITVSRLQTRIRHLLHPEADALPDQGYVSLADAILKEDNSDLQALESYLLSMQQQLDALQSKWNGYDLDGLKADLEQIQQQLADVSTSAKLQQKRDALVLAGTVDSSLRDLIPVNGTPLPISHVFLDEAGYTSLARGMAAFACNAPITFLGDHRQLPPVCVMSKIAPVDAPVCLWSLSVAYISELLDEGPSYLYLNCHESHKEPSFSRTPYYSLNVSYRFGAELADILARYIYGPEFRGCSSTPLEITVLDAPFSPSPYKNSSLSEVIAIREYLNAKHPADFAILTPYNDQLRLLRKNLYFCKDHLLTVHRSQGREWDTVILSVVDRSNPHFTNSLKPIGRSVLNTAISRTKHRIVIVCDISEWYHKPDQLIAELLHLNNSGKKLIP